MKIKQIILITCITLTTLASVACGSNKETTISNSSNLQYDYESIEEQCLEFMHGTSAEELANFESMEINEGDILTSTDSALKYASNSAVYIQVGRYMYRFQLNSDGNIESYIKYSVEA